MFSSEFRFEHKDLNERAEWKELNDLCIRRYKEGEGGEMGRKGPFDAIVDGYEPRAPPNCVLEQRWDSGKRG